MENRKKILIALGSFKDVFNPIESKNLIQKLLINANTNVDDWNFSILMHSGDSCE